MKFHLASDLHLDMYPHEEIMDMFEAIREDRDRPDTLVIAGDVSNGVRVLKYAVDHFLGLYHNVLFVDGNHEHYGTGVKPLKTCNDLFFEYEDGHRYASRTGRRLYYLGVADPNNDYVVVDDTAFIGTNGWYDFADRYGSRDALMDLWKRTMNDARMITWAEQKPWNFAGMEYTHLRDTYHSVIKNVGVENIVAVTHTIPRAEIAESGQYAGEQTNAFFVNTLMEDIAAADRAVVRKLKVWCYGHTHFRNDRVYDGVRYVANPRGYPYENNRLWYPITIDTNENNDERSN